MDNVITIDHQEYGYRQGQTILEVAEENGIHIPTLCRIKGTTPTGACRICLVEVEGARALVASCSMPAAPNMVVKTSSPRVIKARRYNLELLLSSGHHNCLAQDLDTDSWTDAQLGALREKGHEDLCPAYGECKLQDLAIQYQVKGNRFQPSETRYETEDMSPLIIRDFSRCILCGRCVQACNEVQVNRAISMGYRGSSAKVVARGDRPLSESDCVFCGECVQACPVGALTNKKTLTAYRPWETKKIRTTCPYCGVGCQQWLDVKDGKIVNVSGVEEAEPNQGRLCVKGRYDYDFIYSDDRLKTPLIKENGTFRETGWEEALDLAAAKIRQVISDHGPDAIAGVSSAGGINEDSYQMQKLFRAVIGTNNIDHSTHTCPGATVDGPETSFGSGAMTNSFNELARAKMIMVIGSNMVEANPVAATMVKNAVIKGAQLLVVDPERHKLTDFAALHAPIKVGSDIAFLNGLMHVLIKEDLYDSGFVESCTAGFEELKECVSGYTPERAAEICGIPAEMIMDFARRIASVKPMMLCYTPGIAGHTCGKNNLLSMANLQMLLGNMGVECGGVNPLGERNNVQGACDMGALPDVFPGYQPVIDPAARARFEKAWGVPSLPDKNGLMLHQVMEGLLSKKISLLYISGENLAGSEPGTGKVEHKLESAEFIIAQDISPNETTRLADIVFPAAAWSENDGTFTNSERRVSRVRTSSAPPGDARPNWWIFKEIAKRLGHDWASNSAKEIWDNEISELAPQFSGIKYRRLEGNGLQWPCQDEDHPGTRILHMDGQFTGGGVFTPVEWTSR